MVRSAYAVANRLRERIEQARKLDEAIAKLEAERTLVLRDIDAYLDAIRLFGANPSELLDGDLYASPSQQNRRKIVRGKVSLDETKVPPKPGRGGRGMSTKWKQIFSAVVQHYPESFDNTSLIQLAASIGYKIGRPTAQSQMVDYANGGYLERLSDGRYRATELAAKNLGLKLGSRTQKNETPPVDAGSASKTDGENDDSPSSSDEKVTSLFDR